MCNLKKSAGFSVCSFGLGLMMAFFVPEAVLVVMEAAVIIAAGFIFIRT